MLPAVAHFYQKEPCLMRRRRLRTALLATAALAAASLVAVAPAPGPPVVAVADTAAATGSAGLFVPATGRLLDTRNGTGGYSTPMAANVVRTVAAAGVAGIPVSGVSALALTLTAVGAPTAGAISVAPGDVATPTGTALVFNPDDSVSNTDLVALHADGTLHVLSNAAVNLIIDVQGYFTAGSDTAPGGFVALDQSRIVDSRNGTNVPQAQVASGGAITVTAAGLGGVPSDASAVYVNIAVLGQTTNGYLRTYAADAPVPTTGAIGFDNTTQSQSVAIPLSAEGAFTVLVGAGGPVDLIIDIQGYFTAGDTTGGFTPAAVHLLDTRAAPVRTIAGNGLLTLTVAGVAGIPAMGSSLTAVALNVRTVQTASQPASGYLRLWPSDQPEPATSSINYTRLDVYRTDLAIVSPAADGTINIRNGGPAPIDVVIDAEGWFADPGPAVPSVTSLQYPEEAWAAPANDATFNLSDSGPIQPVSYSYSLDNGPAGSVGGQSAAIDLAAPALGSHTLTVSAVDAYGVSSTYSYQFSVGYAADTPQTVTAISGPASLLVSWQLAAGHGAAVTSYQVDLTDTTTGATFSDICSSCSSMQLTDLTNDDNYSATVTALSDAGNSAASTAATAVPDATYSPLDCSGPDCWVADPTDQATADSLQTFEVVGGPDYWSDVQAAPDSFLSVVRQAAATATIAVYDDSNTVDYQQPVDEPDGTALVTSPNIAPTYVLPDGATVRTFAAQSARTPRGYTTPPGNVYDTQRYRWQQTEEHDVGVFNPRNGHIESVVAIKVKMRITGNTSDYWRFDVSLHEKYGPAYTMDAYLDCGVDITGDQDRICHGHHYSNGSTDGAYAGAWQTIHPLATGDNVTAPLSSFFGTHSSPTSNARTAQVKKFALILFSATWPSLDGTNDHYRFRSPSVCVPNKAIFSRVKLC